MNAKRLKSYMSLQIAIGKLLREANKGKFAVWSNMSSPVQLLSGFNERIVPIYPQLRNMWRGKKNIIHMLQVASNNLFSSDLCSDLRCEIGNQYAEKDSRSLRKPDFILASNLTCNSSAGLYYSWVKLNPDVKHYIVEFPYQWSDYVAQSAVNYIKEQFLEVIESAKRVFNLDFDIERFRKALIRMAKSQKLMNKIILLAAHNPSPISVTDFQPFLIPTAYFSHFNETYEYLLELEDELRNLISKNMENKEKIRLCWDFLPLYKGMADIDQLLNDYNAKVVIGTSMTSAIRWPEPELFEETDDPLGLFAYAFAQHHFRRNYRYKIGVMSDWIRTYNINGIIFHSARCCKAHSLPQSLIKEVLEIELGIPILIIEADVLDSQNYSKSQVMNRLEAFLETFE